jgi:plastocyanin
MRVKAGIAVALAMLACAPAASTHPGHGATLVGIGDFKYTPSAVTIVAGDSVLWNWNGPDTNHSVTADQGQSMQFDSDPGESSAQILHPVNDGYGVTFNDPGTYRYHCKVHSSMTGTITVQPAPVAPAPVAPKLSRVSAKPKRFCTRCASPGTTVRYTLDGPASMRALLRRRGRAVKEIDFSSSPGTHSRRLRFRNVRQGTYVLRLIAADNSSGASTTVDLSVQVTSH